MVDLQIGKQTDKQTDDGMNGKDQQSKNVDLIF